VFTRSLDKLAVTVAALVVLLLRPASAAADPSFNVTPLTQPRVYLHISKPFTVQIEGVDGLALPPSYILSEDVHDELDAHVRQLEKDRTRCEAEKKVYRESVSSSRLVWIIAVGAAAVLGGTVGAVVF
jgi:hypothetical protein